MDSVKEGIKTEIEALVKAGYGILLAEGQKRQDGAGKRRTKSIKQEQKNDAEINVPSAYQSWYSRALLVVKQLLPDRYQEFQELYRLAKRNEKQIGAATYTISDYLNGLRVTRGFLNEEVFDHFAAFANSFSRQLAILDSASARLTSILADIRGVLEAQLFDDELEAAQELLKKGHLRAAGALAGVVLERHLGRICENHALQIRKKDPTVADFNEELKKAQVIDVPVWRGIQRSGDIRNLCTHAKQRDPTKEEVEELIQGVQKIVKALF